MFNYLRLILLNLLLKKKHKLAQLEAYKHGSWSFSLCGEDRTLLCLVQNKKQGFYIDLGAYHPIHMSNSYLFYDMGWQGITVEPNPTMCDAHKKYRPRDIALNAAISSENGTATYYAFDSVPVYNTLSEEHANIVAQEYNIEPKKSTIATFKLTTIFEKYTAPGQIVDFMSVDCEGYDIAVLKSNDWTRYRPRILLIEDIDDAGEMFADVKGDYVNNFDTELVRYCTSIGYELISWCTVTKIFRDTLNKQVF